MNVVMQNSPDDLFEHALAKLRRLAPDEDSACKICASPTSLFDVVDFAKTCDYGIYPSRLLAVPVYYRKCASCGFVFTDFFDDFSTTQWGAHVYNDEYKRIDPDYLENRPRANSKLIDGLLGARKDRVIGLDFGGGSGRTCELLRAMGYAYDTYDPFGASSLTSDFAGRYNFCSAFEVAEHSPDPVGFISAIVQMADRGKLAILVGTQVHDREVSAEKRLAWWYAAPRNGHISLYSQRSLEALASKVQLTLTSFSGHTHLMTRGYTRQEAFRFLLAGKIRSRLGRAIKN
jgi:2-polyprenyl-6-hydroxyphenyl methylase/3-demethylubiquinone-9 3-methyltransferase